MGLQKSIYLPCPALLSAESSKEKVWDTHKDLKVIGLGFNIPTLWTVNSNGLSEKAYRFNISPFENIIKNAKKCKQNYKFVGICHYIDELPHALRFFNQFNIPVRYSFNSAEHFDIYSDLDLLISSRVHGCGICASLGIPSIGITHDCRGDTIRGFLSEQLSLDDSMDDSMRKVKQTLRELDIRHFDILRHKEKTLSDYIDLLSKFTDF